MDLNDLLKLAGLAAQVQTVEEPSCGCGGTCSCHSMDESEGAGFDEATTEPTPEEFPDGISTLGSVSDTSLRRYLKAKGDHVTVDEDTYPDYTVEDVNESFAAFKERAKNPYAIGMAQAMKSTGDEPPLKKSTITKAHEIAKAVQGESVTEAAYPPRFAFINNDEEIEIWNNIAKRHIRSIPMQNKQAAIRRLEQANYKASLDTFKGYQMWYMNTEHGVRFSDYDPELEEAAKPDYIDIDGDGDKKEPMKKAAKDKEEANESINMLKALAGIK